MTLNPIVYTNFCRSVVLLNMEDNQDNQNNENMETFQDSQDFDDDLTLGLSDDSTKDPDFDPEKAESPDNSEKEPKKKTQKKSVPLPSESDRSKRVNARVTNAAGKAKVVTDAKAVLMERTSNGKVKKSRTSRKNPKRSAVWQFFKSGEPDKTGTVRVHCTKCSWDARYTSSTSGMSYHLRTDHKIVITEQNNANAPGHSSSESESARQAMSKYVLTKKTVDCKSKDYQTFCRSLARFVITSNSALSIISNPQLKDFVNYCTGTNKTYNLPSTYVLKRNVLQPMAEETTIVLQNQLRDAISFGITTDGWQSGPGDSYESLTAHWVSESDNAYELRSSVLATIPIEDRHTAENLKELLDVELRKWGLTEKHKVYVTDNASNIRKSVQQTGDDGFGCFAHTLNLCVQAGLDVPAISKVIGVIKTAVQFIHKSSVARRDLRNYCGQLRMDVNVVVTSVVTRWNSVLYMLQRVILIRHAFVLTLHDSESYKKNIKYCPSNSDFELIEEMIDVLEIFDSATKLISGEKYPTVTLMKSLIEKITTHLNTNKLNETDPIKEMKKKMLNDFKTRYQSTEIKERLFISAVLDPRNKALLSNVDKKKMVTETFCSIVENCNFTLANSESQVVPCTQGQEIETLSNFPPSSTSKSNTPPEENNKNSKSSQLYSSLFNCIDPEPEPAESLQVNVRDKMVNEIALYYNSPLSTEVKIDKSFDVLKWWYQHKSSYPYLCTMVTYYLCVPASSTPSERCFSTAGNIVTKTRNRLLPENVNMLTFLKNNYHSIPNITKVKNIENFDEIEPMETDE